MRVLEDIIYLMTGRGPTTLTMLLGWQRNLLNILEQSDITIVVVVVFVIVAARGSIAAICCLPEQLFWLLIVDKGLPFRRIEFS